MLSGRRQERSAITPTTIYCYHHSLQEPAATRHAAYLRVGVNQALYDVESGGPVPPAPTPKLPLLRLRKASPILLPWEHVYRSQPGTRPGSR